MPSKDLEKLLRDAELMVKEMEKRNFTPQKTAAQKENDEAQKCETPSEVLLLFLKSCFAQSKLFSSVL